MAEKKEVKVVKELFTANLEMTTIHPKVVTYRVTGHKGLGVLGLHHVDIARTSFPKDDNFNMDFINKKFPKEESELRALQKTFRKSKRLSIKISMA